MVRVKELAEFQQIMEELQSSGLLLESDSILPSVAGLVAHEPIRGSWWGHPRGHDIFRATEQLAAQPDVIACKLVSGKVTYVHRSLWPALARELEKRLLVYSEEIHTETGAHAKVLETWESWAERIGLARRKTTAEQAKEQLEQRLKLLNTRFAAAGRLLWTTTRSKTQDR